MFSLFDRKGKVVLVRAATPPSVPFWCPICSLVISNSIDAETYREIGACRDCENDFVDRDRPRWLSGWRPSSEEVKTAVENRSKPK